MTNAANPSENSARAVIELDRWTVGHHANKDGTPDAWVPARVPGAVQLDWARASGWGDFWYNENFRQYAWMEDVYWTYRHTVDCPSLGEGEEVFLVAEGIDYRFEVRLDGQTLHNQEGMFRAAEVNLTPHLGSQSSVLEVLIHPPPKNPISPGDEARRQADRTCKPPVSYGWDFHPRLVPSGIWQPIRLEIRRPNRLERCELGYTLADDLTSAALRIAVVAIVNQACQLAWRLTSPSGQIAAQGAAPLTTSETIIQDAAVSSPELWWPHDMGLPHRYTLTCTLLSADGEALDRQTQQVGFRRSRLVMYDGQWDLDVGIPATQTPPPITLEINGKRIFARGSCWTPADVFFGTIDRERYEKLVSLSVEAHFNLIRIWGGGIVPPESFFDLCDEKGLMVWQEFPLACNAYEPTPEYLVVLEPEARAIVQRVRKHPSLAMWCGGNELFNNWSRSTMQNRALRMLDSICLELDPLTPFIPTSPLMGMGHGWYAFRHLKSKKDILQYFQECSHTAYTEFGCAGSSPVSYLKSFIPEADLYPPKPHTAWHSHHALWTFCEDGIGWLCMPYVEDYFGPCASLEELVTGSEWLQCEGYKAAFEEARRQKPRCSMALNWCFNEPWPSAANNSLVNWPAEPKPSYFAVRDACRPQMLSARVRRFDYRSTDELCAELWLLNDQQSPIGPQTVRLTLLSKGRVLASREAELAGAEPNMHTKGPSFAFPLADAEPGELVLELTSKERPDLDSRYRLLVRDHAG
jgi:beta-mannosidase